MKHGREKATSMSFIWWKSSDAWNSLSIGFIFCFSEKQKNYLFIKFEQLINFDFLLELKHVFKTNIFEHMIFLNNY